MNKSVYFLFLSMTLGDLLPKDRLGSGESDLPNIMYCFSFNPVNSI